MAEGYSVTVASGLRFRGSCRDLKLRKFAIKGYVLASWLRGGEGARGGVENGEVPWHVLIRSHANVTTIAVWGVSSEN